MLSKLKLKNFKSFSNLDDLKLKPITILCGTNSCGKTSILHSLLLNKQTKESKTSNQLLLNGKYIHLGDFGNIIYGQDDDKLVLFGYEYIVSRKDVYARKSQSERKNREKIRILTEFRRFLDKEFRSNDKVDKYKIYIEYLFKSIENRRNNIKSAGVVKIIIKLSSLFENKEIEGPYVEINKESENYSVMWHKIKPSNEIEFFKKGNGKVIDSGFIESVPVFFEGLSPIIQFNYAEMIFKRANNNEIYDPFSVSKFVHLINSYINIENQELSYIGPLREEPSRRYIYENEVLDIGVKGENAAYIYQTEQDINIKNHFIYNKDSESYEEVDSLSLKDLLESWLQLMGIKNFSHDYESEMIRLKMAANSCEKTMVNIADVGFGVSQIFPILLEGLRMNKNSTFILEQPEIHLHPSIQMKMADYLITLALSKKM